VVKILGEFILGFVEKEPSSPTYYIRAKRPDGAECVIDLMALEDALSGGFPGEAYLLPDSGEIRFIDSDFDEIGGEDEEDEFPDGAEALPLDAISDRERFGWMEDFTEFVRSVPLRAGLSRVLRNKKPFRNFMDALAEYPRARTLVPVRSGKAQSRSHWPGRESRLGSTRGRRSQTRENGFHQGQP